MAEDMARFVAGLLMGSIAFAHAAAAQIVPDDTLGTERSTVTPDRIRGVDADRIDGGARRGGNLFHSFGQFNVDEGRGAYFSNPTGVETIFSRVTGGQASAILGRLGVLGNANLFLINPNGILFGQNASLDVGGSFTATTANALGFGVLGSFNASNPDAPSPLLTVNPSAFLFTQARAGAIVNRSIVPDASSGSGVIGLRVPNEENLTLLGGNVQINGGLIALGGQIEVGSVRGSGTVGLNPNGRLVFPNRVERGNVLLDRARIGVLGNNGGSIDLYARNLDILNRSLLAGGIVPASGQPAQAGDIRLDATERIRIDRSGLGNEILGDSGTTANDVLRRGGNIQISGGSLALRHAQISTATFGLGRSGDINITAENQITLDQRSRINSSTNGAISQAGNININARSLQILNRSVIAAIAAGQPAIESGGNVTIDLSGDLQIFQPGGVPVTGITTGVQAGAIGRGGNISIDANSLFITNGAIDSGITSGSTASSILALAVALQSDNDVGRAGNIQIRVNELFDARNGQFTAFGTNVGGNITVDASNIRLQENTDIQTLSVLREAGNIRLSANSIIAFDDSDIVAFSLFNRGGSVELNTPAFFAENYRPNSVTLRSLDVGNANLNNPREVLRIIRSTINTSELNDFTSGRLASRGNDRVDVDASGAVSGGAITIPDVSLVQNSLAEIPDTAIDTDQLLANSCIARTPQGGTFLITGSDGLPTRPGDPATSLYPTGTVRGSTTDRRSSIPLNETPPAIQEPQGVYQLPNGRLVISRECPHQPDRQTDSPAQ